MCACLTGLPLNLSRLFTTNIRFLQQCIFSFAWVVAIQHQVGLLQDRLQRFALTFQNVNQKGASQAVQIHSPLMSISLMFEVMLEPLKPTVVLSALSICLCSLAEQNTYNRFFTKHKECCLENGLHLNPSVMLSDFEGSIICYIAVQFQDHATKVASTISHRQYGKLSKTLGYKQSTPAMMNFDSSSANCWFLPEWEVSIHYTKLKQQKPSTLPQLDSLLSYFEDTWLDGGQFSPAMCSVLEQDGNRTISWRDGTGSSMQSSVDCTPTSTNW